MIYKRIKDLREDHDLKQIDVADHLKCSQVCYSYYENGKRDIPTDVLIKLSSFYNVSIDYLLGQTDEPKRIRHNPSAIDSTID
ncbi:MAG: helix-turn-helix domain-containing protein [Acutalibacteraceae bacterium]